MRYFIMISVTLALLQIASAEDSEGWRNQTQSKKEFIRYAVQTGWVGYLSLMTGYMGYSPNLDVEGTPTSVKLIGSYVTKNAAGVFDLGYGIEMQSFVTDKGGDRDIANPVLEAAARFQFKNRWQLGVVQNSFFSAGPRFQANQADVHFGGFQVLREFGIGNSFVGRIGARVMTSINVNDEQVNMGAIDLQVGWGQVANWTSLDW